MYGDFARVTFAVLKNRSRVLMQQGRVQLEADWNEQGAIFLDLVRTLTKDLIGPAAGPKDDCGFAILTRQWLQSLPEQDERRQKWLPALAANDFLVGSGRYYVDGLLCTNPELIRYADQAAMIEPAPARLDMTEGALYLAYLDVAEHSVFGAQDESQLEVAIGIETAIRARRTWVVRTAVLKPTDDPVDLDNLEPSWPDLVDSLQSPNRGWLKCRAGRRTDEPSAEACIVAPQSRYRGSENQLYRIEVHRGGVLERVENPKRSRKAGRAADVQSGPTFKFSRVNGSAVYRIESLVGEVATLSDLGRDDRFNLDEGDWVEVLDDSTIPPDRPGALRKVAGVDTFKRQVTLEPLAGSATTGGIDMERHPYMRRWDQHEGDEHGGLQLQEGAAPIRLDDWIHLEDGVEVLFQAPDSTDRPVVFRSGDYWLAPARVATGGIIDWPQVNGEPQALPPHGVEHHYAPLAVLQVAAGQLDVVIQHRRSFKVETEVVTSTA